MLRVEPLRVRGWEGRRRDTDAREVKHDRDEVGEGKCAIVCVLGFLLP